MNHEDIDGVNDTHSTIIVVRPSDDLILQLTALHHAVMKGNESIFRAVMAKNPQLEITGDEVKLITDASDQGSTKPKQTLEKENGHVNIISFVFR